MSYGMRMTWTKPPALMARGVGQYRAHVQRGVREAMDRTGQDAVNYGRANHPWQNRTGAAEAGLHATVTDTGSTMVLEFAHGVPYGVYLEKKFGGRDAIIMPTLEQVTPILADRIRAVLAGGSGG